MIELSTENQHDLPQVKRIECLGVVLAGGLSSRMGVDKSTLAREEVSMLHYSKQLLTDMGLKNIVISGQPSCASPQDILIKDTYKNAGPVGGIASVIEKLKPQSILLLPVDLPLMTLSALQKLKHVGEISQQACFYDDNFLPLYLPVNAFVENFLKVTLSGLSANENSEKKQGPSIRALLKQIPHKAINIEDTNALFNTNTPDEWKTAQSIFSQKMK